MLTTNAMEPGEIINIEIYRPTHISKRYVFAMSRDQRRHR